MSTQSRRLPAPEAPTADDSNGVAPLVPHDFLGLLVRASLAVPEDLGHELLASGLVLHSHNRREDFGLHKDLSDCRHALLGLARDLVGLAALLLREPEEAADAAVVALVDLPRRVPRDASRHVERLAGSLAQILQVTACSFKRMCLRVRAQPLPQPVQEECPRFMAKAVLDKAIEKPLSNLVTLLGVAVPKYVPQDEQVRFDHRGGSRSSGCHSNQSNGLEQTPVGDNVWGLRLCRQILAELRDHLQQVIWEVHLVRTGPQLFGRLGRQQLRRAVRAIGRRGRLGQARVVCVEGESQKSLDAVCRDAAHAAPQQKPVVERVQLVRVRQLVGSSHCAPQWHLRADRAVVEAPVVEYHQQGVQDRRVCLKDLVDESDVAVWQEAVGLPAELISLQRLER
mmetsp:Transcript_13597/g.38253  ORF Transcript_13597/g.38253 Transcript_13597/m.38253 type:complete len:397 (-) Transcript_13597:3184-4374(-)